MPPYLCLLTPLPVAVLRGVLVCYAFSRVKCGSSPGKSSTADEEQLPALARLLEGRVLGLPTWQSALE
jgi:hypothetical protein